MVILPVFKKEDERLRVIAWIMGVGLLILLTGLWVVQIVCAKKFEHNSERQSMRRVGIPAVRGRILDRDGNVLADNRPHYNAVLYLEDLQGQFSQAYTNLARAYGRSRYSRGQLQLLADCQVVSNISHQVSSSLRDPRIFSSALFLRHYTNYPYVPFDIVPDMSPQEVARFAELFTQPDLDIETQPVRVYPNGALAAHVLGYVRAGTPDSGQISYTLPDYEGRTGVERVFDDELRGKAGTKLVLVNSRNYRQREDIENPNEPGQDIYLTIDLSIQRAAEKALALAQPGVRGAVVVMDVRNGDVLAMCSAPAYDPNRFVGGLTSNDMTVLNDPKYTPQINRAIDGAYPPGSTFKIITAIACLESGLDPDEQFDSPGIWNPPHGHPIRDLAAPGKYNLTKAFYRSSNTYFIHYGMLAGLAKILEVAKRFHLGEKTHFAITPEVAGDIPAPDQIGTKWQQSSAPDICIGQEITTTPLQMACMISAIANGGKLFWPRIVSHSYSSQTGEEQELCPSGRLRDTVRINPRHLDLIRRAMMEDTEHAPDGDSPGGTAYTKFHYSSGQPMLANFHVAGKTGTAELKQTSPNSPRRITWFDSYAPYESPRYAVVVMVEDGNFGGPTCAPVAEKIYDAILKREQVGGNNRSFAKN